MVSLSRYGWFPNGEFRSGTFQSPCAFASGTNDCQQSKDTGKGGSMNMNVADGMEMNIDAVLKHAPPIRHLPKQPVESKNRMNSMEEKTVPFSVFPDNSDLPVSTERRATSSSWPQEESRDGMVMKENRKIRNLSIFPLPFLFTEMFSFQSLLFY